MKSKTIYLLPILFLWTLSIQAQTEKSQEPISPKIFVVLDITVHDTIMYEQYRVKVEPIIKSYNGKYLVRSGGMAFDKDPDKMVIPGEGNWNPNRLIILEWNSMEELQKFINSTEYQKVAELRKKSASTKSVIVKENLTD
ncbi:DUF1330 domain-containing protein [Aegicerativicinus sediminis]|uniref:DUF1330 domain-containing protein n=1 Tax=Aegicerativicinus sediminis TaxID=2893202 RepID=UPI001E2C4D31|nr:DUF1330 domain-containing protein [Aegicerativicinus sediminis]